MKKICFKLIIALTFALPVIAKAVDITLQSSDGQKIKINEDVAEGLFK